MAGTKFKVVYRKADTGKWSGSEIAQRKRGIKFLYEMIDRMEKQQKQAEKEREKAKAKKE